MAGPVDSQACHLPLGTQGVPVNRIVVMARTMILRKFSSMSARSWLELATSLQNLRIGCRCLSYLLLACTTRLHVSLHRMRNPMTNHLEGLMDLVTTDVLPNLTGGGGG